LEAGITNWEHTFFLPDGRHVSIATLMKTKEMGEDKPDGPATPEKKGPIATKEKTKIPPPFVIWDVAAGKIIHTFDDSQLGNFIDRSQVSPNGNRLYLSRANMTFAFGKPRASQTDLVFELPSGRLISEVPSANDDKKNEFADITAMSPNGDRMLALNMSLGGEGSTIRSAYWTIRAVPSGEELLRIPNRAFTEHGNGFSADGRLVALSADKGQVEIWDTEARTLLFRWQPHGVKNVEFLNFAPDGDLATVAQGDGRLTILRMNEVRERLSAMGLGW
jgi:WD40 repeat protein